MADATDAPGKVPSPGEAKAGRSHSAHAAGKASTGQIPDSGKAVKTADEKEALRVAAEKGASTPPGSEDKQAKGIQPAADPARRIDEMTNEEARQYSRDQNGGGLHTGDESRPAGKGELLGSDGRRTAEAEANYRDHYSKGWNDHHNEVNNVEDYRGGPVEDKSAYIAGWQGADRESKIGHQGGDMKRGEFEKARISGDVPEDAKLDADA